MSITLIGLGIREGDLTKSAERALNNAGEIIARTSKTASFSNLNGYKVRTLDNVFKSSKDFDKLNENLAAEVIKAGKKANICYCVDGAVSEDEACKKILASGGVVTVYEGVSHSSYVCNAAKLTRADITAVSAYGVRNLKSCEYFSLSR